MFSNENSDTAKNYKWENIVSTVKDRKVPLNELFTDDKIRIRILFFCVYALFGFVSLGMTVLNYFTCWYALMVSTFIFGVANVINLCLCLISQESEYATRVLFAIESILLFLFFAIVGEPEGFSIIWSALLPTCGMLLYRFNYGIVIAGIQQVILVFLFWTPLGKSLLMYDYTESFLSRFPILYTAFFAAGILFEFVRNNTQQELYKTRNKFEYLSNHDALTGLFNRYGFNINMDKLMAEENKNGIAFAILDIDHFKVVNDTYGHHNGDTVLKNIAKEIADAVGENGIVSRWGGEEFSILFNNASSAVSICNNIISKRRENDFMFDDRICHVTISIGLLQIEAGKKLTPSEIITKADANLYTSKENGRDRLTESSIF